MFRKIIFIIIALSFIGCNSFEVYDKSTIKEENIYYTTLQFYAQKDKEKNDVVINEAMKKLYEKLNKIEIENKTDFCKKVAFGKDEVNESDLRYVNFSYCINKKINIE